MFGVTGKVTAGSAFRNGSIVPTLAVFESNSGPTFIDISTVGGSLTLDIPPGTVTGNLLLACVMVNDAAPFNPIPAGWTLITHSAGDVGSTIMSTYWKIATSSEPATYTWTTSGVDSAGGGIMRISGFNTVTPINGDGASGSVSGAGNDVIAPAITTSSDDVLVFRFVGMDNGGAVTLTGNIYSASGGNGTNIFILAHNSGGSVNSVPAENFGLEPSGNPEWSAQTIAISPG